MKFASAGGTDRPRSGTAAQPQVLTDGWLHKCIEFIWKKGGQVSKLSASTSFQLLLSKKVIESQSKSKMRENLLEPSNCSKDLEIL